MIINYYMPIRLEGQYCMSWLNMGVLILLTSLITFITLYPTVAIAFQFTEHQLISLCNQMNQAAYQINQVPYLINQYVYQVHQTVLDHLKRFLLLSVDIIKYVIIFIIDVYKSTYRCLFAFAINTVLAILTSIMKPLQQITESVLKGIDTVVDSIGSIFNQENASSIPTTLSNWTLSMEQTQQKVNQWTTGTDTLHKWISQSFLHLQQQINSSFITSNHASNLPMENKNNHYQNINNQSSSFIYNNTIEEMNSPYYSYYCTTTTVINHLHEAESSIKWVLHIGIIILVVLILLCIVVKVMYLRYRQHYLQKLRFQVVDAIESKSEKKKEEVSLTQIQKNNLLLNQESMLAYYGEVHQSPLLFSFFNRMISSRSSSSSSSSFSKWQQWLLYMTQSSAFMHCLYIGVIGLIVSYSVLFILHSYFQTTVMPKLDHHINEWMTDTVQNTTSSVQLPLNNQWQATNQWINTSEAIINNYLFGFIRELAVPLNITLENTIHHLSELVSTTVEHTIMEQPAKEVINCLLINKLENLQQGLEWIIKNSYVELPRLKFTNYPTSLSFHLMDTITSKYILDTIENQLKQQIIYYWILVGLWFIGAIIGFYYIKKYSPL